MKQSFCIISLVFLSCLSLASQESKSDFETKSNEFGIHAGFSTALGLSYRHWFSNNGVQLTFLPIFADDLTFVSGGFTILHSFKESKYFRFYGYLGNHLLYNTEAEYETQYNLGIGPGFAFGKTVRFNLMVGYGLYDVFNRLNMLPTGEMGLYFCF
jgi:hypothetical protein